MNSVYDNIFDLIGETPMLRLNKLKERTRIKSNIIAKLEYFNPAGSIKDRVAKALIEDAENKGILTNDSTIIEPTSGNTGIGLACVSAAKGYNLILTMPETMSMERRNLLKSYGAEVILTDGAKGMNGAIEEAKRLAKEISNSFIPSQFENMVNPLIHKKTTGPEIWDGLDGNVDILVAGVGTGGTISGVGEFLKSRNSNIRVVAVEPFDSPVLSEGIAGKHKIQGIGAGFVPKTLDTEIYDEIVKVKYEDTIETMKLLTKSEGLFVGISSSAVVWAACNIAKRKENIEKNIVVVLPDSGERYLSVLYK